MKCLLGALLTWGLHLPHNISGLWRRAEQLAVLEHWSAGSCIDEAIASRCLNYQCVSCQVESVVLCGRCGTGLPNCSPHKCTGKYGMHEAAKKSAGAGVVFIGVLAKPFEMPVETVSGSAPQPSSQAPLDGEAQFSEAYDKALIRKRLFKVRIHGRGCMGAWRSSGRIWATWAQGPGNGAVGHHPPSCSHASMCLKLLN